MDPVNRCLEFVAPLLPKNLGVGGFFVCLYVCVCFVCLFVCFVCALFVCLFWGVVVVVMRVTVTEGWVTDITSLTSPHWLHLNWHSWPQKCNTPWLNTHSRLYWCGTWWRQTINFLTFSEAATEILFMFLLPNCFALQPQLADHLNHFSEEKKCHFTKAEKSLFFLFKDIWLKQKFIRDKI